MGRFPKPLDSSVKFKYGPIFSVATVVISPKLSKQSSVVGAFRDVPIAVSLASRKDIINQNCDSNSNLGLSEDPSHM